LLLFKKSSGSSGSAVQVDMPNCLAWSQVLLDQEVVWALIACRAFPCIQPRLQHQQTDESRSLTGVQLDDHVARVLSLGVPFCEDGKLSGAQWPLIMCSIEVSYSFTGSVGFAAFFPARRSLKLTTIFPSPLLANGCVQRGLQAGRIAGDRAQIGACVRFLGALLPVSKGAEWDLIPRREFFLRQPERAAKDFQARRRLHAIHVRVRQWLGVQVSERGCMAWRRRRPVHPCWRASLIAFG
jgi:energy-converting hydrogenase Eha subunit A